MASREYPTRPIPAVGAVIIHDGRVLLIQRGKPPRMGEWSIPGGGIELGETARDAVQREIREELGIAVELRAVVDVIDLIWRDDNERIQFQYVIVDYLGVNPHGELKPADDVMDARWSTPDELPAFNLPDVTVQVIHRAFAMANETDA